MRYRGSFAGIIWSFLIPIIILGIYTFVFSFILRTHWRAEDGSTIEYVFLLYAGLIVYNLFSECTARFPTLILSNVNLVKKVIFPLEILPLVTLGSALFHAVISFGIWLIAYLIVFGLPHPTFLLMLGILLPLLLMVAGMGWVLASIGVYFRDLSQIVGLLNMALMFLAPIFYPPEIIPEAFRKYLLLNPITLPIAQLRDVMYWGKLPDLKDYLVYFCVSSAFAWLSFLWFQRVRKGFADVV